MSYPLLAQRRLALLVLLFAANAAPADDVKPKPKTWLERWLSGKSTAADAAAEQIQESENLKNKAGKSLDAFELSEVEVVATTPLGSTGLDLKKAPGNIQSVEDEEIVRHESFAITDFMNRRLQSVIINDNQNNPYQPDISYRGFSASPLLGTPIGISVYQDGVRVNEAFGDTVNWDLIPQIAIANMELIPGSNPLFGLNTLGGALSMKTKSGFSHPGFKAQASGGSYGRQNYQAEYGGYDGKVDWYLAGNLFGDDGWRPFSATSVDQGFGKVGWEDDKTDLDLSFTFANNVMNGVGPTPSEMLQQNWAAINTAPDTTKNTLYFVNLKGSHQLSDSLQLSGNAYYRNSNTFSLNSNTNNDCTAWINGKECSTSPGQPLEQPGQFAAAWIRQNGSGSNLQMTSDYKILGHENQFITGGGFNYSNTHYYQAQQNAIFNANLYEIPTSVFAPQVQLIGQNSYSNMFATDTFSVLQWVHATAALNWIQAEVHNSDQLGSALNSYYHYQRVNPSAGLTANPFTGAALPMQLKETTVYFNYNEGFRAPSAIELGCADKNNPCSLPNSMSADPYLKPVVSHTLETGLRGKLTESTKWNLNVYQTINTNDILFLNTQGKDSLIYGYFSNVGKTQRQGLEFGLSGQMENSFNWYLSYSYINATYQTHAPLNNAYGNENVVPGDHIPGIPQNSLKFGAEYEVFRDFVFGGDLQYFSKQYARGDDQNIYTPIPDYTILNLNARYRLTKNVELFAMGRNVLDNHYLSFGQMGQNFYTGANTQFQGPGAVAAGYAGIRFNW